MEKQQQVNRSTTHVLLPSTPTTETSGHCRNTAPRTHNNQHASPKTRKTAKRPRRRKKARSTVVGFLNIHGGRRRARWEELYQVLQEERVSLYAIAETHLRDLEEPPLHPDWSWAGSNRSNTSRKGGGVGFLWHRERSWEPLNGACENHKWVTGRIHNAEVIACVVYLGVSHEHYSENVGIARCIREDIQRWGRDKEVLLLGDFNGHIQELDGYLDHNGGLMQALAEDLELEVVNLRADCEGTITWCARGSSTSIDYALISPGLSKMLHTAHIDEEGRYSLGSDHNRIKLEFDASPWRRKKTEHRKPASRYLPVAAYEEVAKEFEDSARRRAATTYEEYVEELRRIMRKHEKRVNSRGGPRRKSWWDNDVQAALRARRLANRKHRQAVKTLSKEAAQEAWKDYLLRKHEMQVVTQRKIAEADNRKLQDIKSAGKGATAKFWSYVSSLDRRASAAEIREEDSGAVTDNLQRHLTEHIRRLYAAPKETDCSASPPDAPRGASAATGYLSHLEWTVSRLALDKALSHISPRTAQGLDGIPAGIVKILGDQAREQLADIYSGILAGQPIPADWTRGRVILTPKKGGDKGLLSDHRPLTITSVLYRVFAQVLKAWMVAWAETGKHLSELQNGFRHDRRLEDNLFVLTQCIEIARSEGRELMSCFLDVSKAYDNVPHDTLLRSLQALEMPPTWVDVLHRLYTNNTVVATVNGAVSDEVPVQKGLKQGCPLSPLLYMLYTAPLERNLLQADLGFRLEYSTEGLKSQCFLPGLVFADDIVLLASTSEELQRLVDICADTLARLGLCFNANKSAVLCFAGDKDAEPAIRLPCGDPIVQHTKYRYLGVHLSTEAKYLTAHEDHLRQASKRASTVLRRRCLWGCNRFLMVRELWKSVHVPALTFANAVICLTSPTREWLERGQRAVGRLAPGCHGRVANEAIQGELGWSTFEAREAHSKLAYDGRLRLMAPHRWARRVFAYVHQKCIRTAWTKRVQHLRNKFGFFANEVRADTARGWARLVGAQVQQQEQESWRKAMEKKDTLQLYRRCKPDIKVERLYDNSTGSALLFEARAGALRTLEYRSRFDASVTSTLCRACGEEAETTEHVVRCCRNLFTPLAEGATLPQLLGFEPLENSPSHGGSEQQTTGALVTVAKKRLSEWWTIVRR